MEFAKSYEESGPGTPIFFILSPGVDPLKDVEALGKKIGFTIDNKNFHNVSLGQVSNGRIAFMLFCSMYPHFEVRYFKSVQQMKKSFKFGASVSSLVRVRSSVFFPGAWYSGCFLSCILFYFILFSKTTDI